MYILLVFAFPFAFFGLRASCFPVDERSQAARTFVRGIFVFLPFYVVWNLSRRIVPTAYGSWLAIFRLSWEYFLLPFGLAAASFRLFGRFGDAVESSACYRRWFSHMAGVLSPLGTAVMIEHFGTRNAFILLAWPILLPAFALFAPFAVTAAIESWGGFRIAAIAASLGLVVGFGLPAAFFISRLEIAGSFTALAAVAVAVYFGIPRLREQRSSEKIPLV